MNKHLRSLSILTAVVTASLVGCSGAEQPADDDSSDSAETLGAVDQVATDVVSLTAHPGSSIGRNGEPGFAPSDCRAVSAQVMDCTKAMEARFGVPALHAIYVGTSQFSCSAWNIETVSRKGALDASTGIGFYYRGYGDGPKTRFIAKKALKKVRDVTLKDGTPGVVHTFVGLAGCDQGSSSASAGKSYEFKAYMKFVGSGKTYRNWEPGENHLFRGTTLHMDRASELLR